MRAARERSPPRSPGGYHDADQLRNAGPDLKIDHLTQLIPLLQAPRA
jgi:phosphoglycolate phosphatase-like HAD superfamily hydrolase